MFAVKSWNADGSYVEYTVDSKGLPVWEGKAASQSYDNGWLQAGGGNQVFVPQAAKLIPKNLPRIPTNWS